MQETRFFGHNLVTVWEFLHWFRKIKNKTRFHCIFQSRYLFLAQFWAVKLLNCRVLLVMSSLGVFEDNVRATTDRHEWSGSTYFFKITFLFDKFSAYFVQKLHPFEEKWQSFALWVFMSIHHTQQFFCFYQEEFHIGIYFGFFKELPTQETTFSALQGWKMEERRKAGEQSVHVHLK